MFIVILVFIIKLSKIKVGAIIEEDIILPRIYYYLNTPRDSASVTFLNLAQTLLVSITSVSSSNLF